jgi:nitrite reductase/ring-hydroxylating ferredoxin subunit
MIAYSRREETIDPNKYRQSRALRRERLAWLAGGASLLLLLSSVALLGGILLYQGTSTGLVDTMALDEVRPNIIIHIDRTAAGERGFFLVRTNDGILALSEMPSHPRALPVTWVRSSELFIDPALGCSFKMDGSYVRGPCVRDLDRYRVAVQDGRIVVDILHPTPGTAHN